MLTTRQITLPVLCALITTVLGYSSTTHSSDAASTSVSPERLAQMRMFVDVFQVMKSGYVELVDDKKLVGACLNGMVSGIDSESSFLDSDSFKQLVSSGASASIGLELGIENGQIKIVTPIEGTPAYAAGLRSGDLIIKIDESPTKGMTLAEAVNRLRGKLNTQVSVTITRTGESGQKTYSVTRELIKIQSVKSRFLEPQYAYLRVSQFQEGTGSSLVENLKDIYQKEDLKGLILDLRNNAGGILTSAIAVAAVFLPKNTLIFTTEGRIPDAKGKYLATPSDYLRGGPDYQKDLPAMVKNVPLVVLVNEGTAAGSEIVAASLQDHKRAILVGTRTSGRASIQTVLPLAGNSAIKLTTSRWYTPSGRTVQSVGITPTVLVTEIQGDGLRQKSDQQLNKALALLKGEEHE